MNDSDKQKVGNAILVVMNIEGHLENLKKRGPAAVKTWIRDANNTSDAALRQTLKSVIVPGLIKLLKDASSVRKDVGSLFKEGSDAGKLAKYATGKAFREKATRLLATAKAFEEKATSFHLALTSVLGGGMYPGMGDVAVKATVVALKSYSTYYNAIRIELGKL